MPDINLKNNLKGLVAYLLFPIVVGFLHIYKIFFISGYLAFEAFDEVGHTFNEVTLAWKAVSAKTICLINLFHNFGTPTLGDPATNTFAPHVIPYIFFNGPLAATIDRFLIVSLTVSILTYFYRRHFSFSLLVSSACAVMVILMPVFSQCFKHLMYQAVALYFVLILIAQRNFSARPDLKNLIGLYLSLMMFALGVGIQGFFLGLPFIVINQYFVSERKLDRNFSVLMLLILSVFVFSYPCFSSFFEWASTSPRLFYDAACRVPYVIYNLVCDLLFHRMEESDFRAVYCPLSLVITGVIGLVQLRRDGKKVLFWNIFILGVAPFVTVMLILFNNELRSHIPLLNTVDITKSWWFSNIFLMIAVGYALQRIRDGAFTGRLAIIISFLSGLVYVSYVAYFYLANKFEKVLLYTGNGKLLPVVGFAGLLLAAGSVVGFFYAYRARNTSRVNFIAALLSLALVFFPLFAINLRMFDAFGALLGKKIAPDPAPSGGMYNEVSEGEFKPEYFMDMIKPYSRVATNMETAPYGYWMATTNRNIFGTNSKTVIVQIGFVRYLLSNGVIKDYEVNYHVGSEDADKLSLLGIKYLITVRPIKPSNHGWKLLSDYLDQSEGRHKYLYENRRDVNLGYLVPVNSGDVFHFKDKKVDYLDSNAISYGWNSIRVSFPEMKKESSLILTFVNWTGWKVLVDGEPRGIESSPDYFLRVKVRPGDRTALFYYEPFSKAQLLLFVLLSLGIFGAIGVYIRANKAA